VAGHANGTEEGQELGKHDGNLFRNSLLVGLGTDFVSSGRLAQCQVLAAIAIREFTGIISNITQKSMPGVHFTPSLTLLYFPQS
jgi:hypothetical protein